MKEKWYEIMFGFIKKRYTRLTITANDSNHTKHVSLNNQQCMKQPTLINLYPNEYTQGLLCYPFAINLNRCLRSCNTLNDFSTRVCISTK